MKTIKKQRGVALFVTLLVVSIATLLATEIWFNNTLDISRQFNNRSAYQANHYARGMFLWVRGILQDDFEQDSEFDNHNDIWNQSIAGIQLDDAILSGKLNDLDGKFNLNNLVIRGVVNNFSLEFFKRILINLELEPAIADKIIDWLDNDQIPMPQGAEDANYLSSSPSYRTAGQQFFHISELRLVAGIDAITYQRLKNYVAVLPILIGEPTKLNINTASILLLKSLDVRITTKDAINLFNDGFASNKTLADFYQQPSIQFYKLGDVKPNLRKFIATKSKWFEAQVSVQMQESNFQKYALVHRLSERSIVEQWSDTPFQ